MDGCMRMDEMPGPRHLGEKALKRAEDEQIRIFEAVFWKNLKDLQAGCSGSILIEQTPTKGNDENAS